MRVGRKTNRKFRTRSANRAGVRTPIITDEVREMLAAEEGFVPHPLTNDRMFRGIVSYSVNIRKGLAAILLDKPEDEIISAVVLNPISFGRHLGRKKTEEDVRLLVNDTTVLNIEMQNTNLDSNNKRFLAYFCRNFDTLEPGEDYNTLKASLLVEIANYSFDKEHPEFYSEYRIQNKKTGRPLFEEDDFFGLNILDLNNSSFADSKDRQSGRLLLAKLCRARTWEELKNLGRESGFAQEVAEVMFIANADQRERWQLEAARRERETRLTLEHERDNAVQRAKESEARASAAESRADAAEARAHAAEEEITVLKEKIQSMKEERK